MTQPKRKHEFKVRCYLSKHKRSQYYQAILIYMDPAGREVRKSITTKQCDYQKAESVMNELVQEIEKSIYHSASPESLFADFLEYWLNTYIYSRIQKTTLYGYKLNMYNHLIPFFRPLRIRLKDLKAKNIYQFINYKLEHDKLNANSVNRFLANLKGALEFAVSLDLINFNPARGIKSLKSNPYEAVIFTKEQIANLIELCYSSDIWPAVFLTAIYGFRRGEILGLRWKNIDFQNKRIYINETRTRASSEIIKSVKTPASRRSMPMIEIIENSLLNIKEGLGKNFDEEKYLITNGKGEKMPVSVFSKKFERMIKNSSLPHIRFHDIRHSVASYLLNNGQSIEAISTWLGHGCIITTAKYYTHFDMSLRNITAKEISNIFEPLLSYPIPQHSFQ